MPSWPLTLRCVLGLHAAISLLALGSGAARADPPAAEAVTAASAASDPAVVGQAMYEDATTDLRRDIAAIRAPVTVLYPWDDRSNDKPAEIDRFYHAQYAALPGARLQRVDGSRHFIMIDQPAAFDAAVDAFLGR